MRELESHLVNASHQKAELVYVPCGWRPRIDAFHPIVNFEGQSPTLGNFTYIQWIIDEIRLVFMSNNLFILAGKNVGMCRCDVMFAKKLQSDGQRNRSS